MRMRIVYDELAKLTLEIYFASQRCLVLTLNRDNLSLERSRVCEVSVHPPGVSLSLDLPRPHSFLSFLNLCQDTVPVSRLMRTESVTPSGMEAAVYDSQLGILSVYRAMRQPEVRVCVYVWLRLCMLSF